MPLANEIFNQIVNNYTKWSNENEPLNAERSFCLFYRFKRHAINFYLKKELHRHISSLTTIKPFLSSQESQSIQRNIENQKELESLGLAGLNPITDRPLINNSKQEKQTSDSIYYFNDNLMSSNPSDASWTGDRYIPIRHVYILYYSFGPSITYTSQTDAKSGELYIAARKPWNSKTEPYLLIDSFIEPDENCIAPWKKHAISIKMIIAHAGINPIRIIGNL